MTTAYAGIMPYLDLWNAPEMPRAVSELVSIFGSQGWFDSQVVQSLVLINLIGDDCVTDVDKLEKDRSLCTMVWASEYTGMSVGQRTTYTARTPNSDHFHNNWWLTPVQLTALCSENRRHTQH